MLTPVTSSGAERRFGSDLAWLDNRRATISAWPDVATGFDIAAQSPESVAFAIIALTALAMGFRNAAVRALKVPDLTTTVLTLTITGIAADSRFNGGDAGNFGRRLAAILAIFVGAAIGGLLVLRFCLAVPLATAGAVVLGGALFCARRAD